jgi:hypothetical protein
MADQLDKEVIAALSEEVEDLSEDVLREELKKLMAQDAKRKVRQAEYNKSPEAQMKRKEYYEKTKDKRAEYRKKYNARKRLMLQRAKDLGLDKEVEAELAASA